MKFSRVPSATVVALTLLLAACGPKDADLKAAADSALAATPGASATVAKGVATVSGQFANDAAKSSGIAAVQGVKGIKSVVDSATVTPPPPPVVLSPDDSLKANITTAIKDFPTVTIDVKDGVVTVNGEISKADLPKLMQALSTMHPKKIDNKAKVLK